MSTGMIREVFRKATGVITSELKKRGTELSAGLKQRGSGLKQRGSEMKAVFTAQTISIEERVNRNPLYRASQVLGSARMMWTAAAGGAAWLVSFVWKKDEDKETSKPPLTTADGEAMQQRLSTVEADYANVLTRLTTLEIRQQRKSNESVQSTPAPVQSTPAPVQSTPAPVTALQDVSEPNKQTHKSECLVLPNIMLSKQQEASPPTNK